VETEHYIIRTGRKQRSTRDKSCGGTSGSGGSVLKGARGIVTVAVVGGGGMARWEFKESSASVRGRLTSRGRNGAKTGKRCSARAGARGDYGPQPAYHFSPVAFQDHQFFNRDAYRYPSVSAWRNLVLARRLPRITQPTPAPSGKTWPGFQTKPKTQPWRRVNFTQGNQKKTSLQAIPRHRPHPNRPAFRSAQTRFRQFR